MDRTRRLLGSGAGMLSMVRFTTGVGEPARQTQLAPNELEFCEDLSLGR